MSKMIQIRNVPDDVHRKLKIRAAKGGMSLSAMLLREVTRLADTPTIEELVERIRQMPSVEGSGESIVDIIHAEREARDESLWEVMQGKWAAQ